MVRALSVVFGVLALVGSAASFIVIRRVMRPLRESSRARKGALSLDDWRATARTLGFRKRRFLARATRRQERVEDPQLARLVVLRAEYLLRSREIGERYDVLRRFQTVLGVTGGDCALIGAYLLMSWWLVGEPALLVGAIFFFAYVPYLAIIVLILPRLYRRETRALRRTLEVNGGPVK
jgi:hypothetical protein